MGRKPLPIGEWGLNAGICLTSSSSGSRGRGADLASPCERCRDAPPAVHDRGSARSAPVPDVNRGVRDPANVRRELREATGKDALAWITSHTFRKTAAMILDEAALSARLVAHQLGHSRPSMTQDVYMGRRAVGSQAALALEAALRMPDKE